MNWRVVRAIAQKDIVDAVKNLYILFALVLPVGLSLLLGVVFPDQEDLRVMTVAVHDPGSSGLVAALRATPDLEIIDVSTADELAVTVEEKATGGIDVPAGFDAAVAAGEQPELTVYLNRRRGGGELAVFQRLIEQQVWGLVEQRVPARVAWQDVGSPMGLQKAGSFDFGHYMLVILLVMGLAMAGTFVVPTLLVEEKEKRTLDALLVSPARPIEVVAGKALTGLVYSLLTAALLIALNRGWAGNWPLTAAGVFLGSLFVVAVGLLMGGLCRNTNQVNTWSSIVMLVLMIPSWSGIMGTPAPLEAIFSLVPTQYLGDILRLSLAGETQWGRLGVDLAVLVGSTVLVMAAVVWTLRRERK